MDRLPDDPIERRAILDFLTWRHSHSCISNDLPVDCYDQNDVERLCARVICLRKMKEEHTTAPAAEGALIPLPTPNERKMRKRASEVGSSAPKVEQVEGLDDASNFLVDLENILENTGSTPVRAVSAPTLHLGKKLRPPQS
nr:hypothetical protein [Tanacetum cinerariifolium]